MRIFNLFTELDSFVCQTAAYIFPSRVITGDETFEQRDVSYTPESFNFLCANSYLLRRIDAIQHFTIARLTVESGYQSFAFRRIRLLVSGSQISLRSFEHTL